jgi:hypothetical protein
VRKWEIPQLQQSKHPTSWSHWPSSLRRGSAADRWMGLRDRIPPAAWMFVSFVSYIKDKSKSQNKQDKKKVRIKCKERTTTTANPFSVWTFVSFVCCVGRGLCEELITRLEDSYWVFVCLIVFDVRTISQDALWPEFDPFTTKIIKQIANKAS